MAHGAVRGWRVTTFPAFLGAIRRLAAQGPVVIAIDDLQWLDRPSLTALAYALRRLGTEPVGLLASARARSGGPAASLAGAGLMAGRLVYLRIGPLALADFEAAIWASASGRLPRQTIRRLFEASGGNLFYGLELARALGRMETEPSPGEPLPVPAGLQGVLSTRIAALPEEVQDVLLVASCLRYPTTAVLELANGPSAWTAVQSAAAEDVVEIEGSSVRFIHPLFASAIYSGGRAGNRSVRGTEHGGERRCFKHEWRKGEAAAAEGEDCRDHDSVARASWRSDGLHRHRRPRVMLPGKTGRVQQSAPFHACSEHSERYRIYYMHCVLIG